MDTNKTFYVELGEAFFFINKVLPLFFSTVSGGLRNPTYYSLNCKVVTKFNLGIPRGEKYMRGLERSKERN